MAFFLLEGKLVIAILWCAKGKNHSPMQQLVMGEGIPSKL